MKSKRTYFPPTTTQQRKVLFETWEQTHNVAGACKKAHVGMGTFYKWKPRFEKDGYAGLENTRKLGAPVGTGRIAPEIESKVVELHKAHEDWGKKRLADEIAKGNNWVPLVSRNCVRRILRDAGLWKPETRKPKKSRFSQ